MRLFFLLSLLATSSASAASITNLSVSNLSDPDFSLSGPNGQTEFRSAIVSTSGPTPSGLLTTVGARLSWLLAGRAPEGVATPDFTNVRIGYEISFTVSDPSNAGYILSAASSLRGWNSALWTSGDSGQLGGGIGAFSAEASQDGSYIPVPALALYDGAVSVDESTPEDNSLLAESANTAGVYFATGSHNFSLRLLAPLSFVGSSGPAGEAALRYGLQPLSPAFVIAGTPGPDGEDAGLLGLDAEISVFGFDDPQPNPIPEPYQALPLALALGAFSYFRSARRRLPEMISRR
jgi:hypothetical protein